MAQQEGVQMIPKHLVDRRDEFIYKYEFSISDDKQIAKDFYDAAVADMLKEVAPLVEALEHFTKRNNSDAYNHEEATKALQSWREKFGEIK